MVIHGNFRDFGLFLMIHIAHVDGSLHEQEELVVRQKLAVFFPEQQDPVRKFHEALEQYRGIRQEMIPVLIRETFKHFSAVRFAEKYKVYTNLFDIINADGRVDVAESQALKQLRELMSDTPTEVA